MKITLLLSLMLLIVAAQFSAAEAPKGPTVMISGAVARPGVYAFRSGMMLSALLSLSGGPAIDAALHIELDWEILSGPPRRLLADQVTSKSGPRWCSFRKPGAVMRAAVLRGPKDFPLHPGDEIYVWSAIGEGVLITRYFKDVPFVEAVDSILKGTSYSYSIDPSLAEQNLKVTASLKNISVESAINTLSRAAGASYQVDKNLVVIGSQAPGANALYYRGAQQQVQNTVAPDLFVQKKNAAAGGSAHSVGSQFGAQASQNRSETIDLNYVQAGDVLPLVSNVQGVQEVRSAGAQRIVVTAPQSAIDEAREAIGALDTEDAWPRPVVVGLRATVSLGDKNYSWSTEARTADGVQAPLNLSASDIDLGSGRKGQLEMQALATPVVMRSPVDGRDISLVGSGTISGAVPARFRQQFDFAVSLASCAAKGDIGATGPISGDQPVIASGSINAGGTNIGFQVTAVASVERGRVASQTRGFGQSGAVVHSAGAAEESIRTQNADRNQARSLVIKGSDMLEQGRIEEAGRHFQEALILDPDNAAAHNGLGKALLGQGKTEEATVELREAVRLDPVNLGYQQDLHKRAGVGTDSGGQGR